MAPFTFSDNTNGELILHVVTYVAKAKLVAPDWLVTKGAGASWMLFGDRLGTNMWFHQGCKPLCRPPGQPWPT